MLLKILKVKKETKDCFSIIFVKPKGFHYIYAGQYLDIKLPVKDSLGKTRAFSLSSSPTEGFLMITPKKGISPFKKHLVNLRPGNTIQASHPTGTFILDETESAVFIAGGIGITPFRSMIKYALDNKLTIPITLIYSNSNNNFLFKAELEDWKKQLSDFQIFYYQTNQAGRLKITISDAIVQHNVTAIYYLAGPPKMVDDFAKMLLDLGIDETNIRYDRFDGY